MPKSERKFYKTIIQVEVLSEDPLENTDDLAHIHYLITGGDCSGVIKTVSINELDGSAAAKALLEQGSDTEFFQLTADGEDVDE